MDETIVQGEDGRFYVPVEPDNQPTDVPRAAYVGVQGGATGGVAYDAAGDDPLAAIVPGVPSNFQGSTGSFAMRTARRQTGTGFLGLSARALGMIIVGVAFAVGFVVAWVAKGWIKKKASQM